MPSASALSFTALFCYHDVLGCPCWWLIQLKTLSRDMGLNSSYSTWHNASFLGLFMKLHAACM
eukprot:5657027-Amphidinium_carterae.2